MRFWEHSFWQTAAAWDDVCSLLLCVLKNHPSFSGVFLLFFFCVLLISSAGYAAERRRSARVHECNFCAQLCNGFRARSCAKIRVGTDVREGKGCVRGLGDTSELGCSRWMDARMGMMCFVGQSEKILTKKQKTN